MKLPSLVFTDGLRCSLGFPGRTDTVTGSPTDGHTVEYRMLPASKVFAVGGKQPITYINYTVCTDFPNVVAERHIFEGEGTHPGGYDSQIRTRPRFLYNAPISKVSLSYVYSFGSYRVDKHTNLQTNKQTPLKTSNVLRYATTLGNYV